MRPDTEVYSGTKPILYWSLDNGRMMLANGDHFPITTWIDETGEDTDDGNKVWAVVAGPDKRGKFWQTNIDICPWEPIH